jgi:hypothetical protein
VRRTAAIGAAAAVLSAVAAAAPAEAAGRAPVVHQMVVFRSGDAKAKRVSTRTVRVRVRRKRCRVATGTALAALVRSDPPGRIRLRDYGSCSERARDGAGLFVSGIGPDRNRGRNGWVYKVGRKGATAGAADPAGPFGTGRRLGPGQRVTWFYCILRDRGCQRSLALRLRTESGALVAKVVGFDDEGRGVVVPGAMVRAGAVSVLTGADGRARLTLPPGRYRVKAEKRGLVRSFSERVTVG